MQPNNLGGYLYYPNGFQQGSKNFAGLLYNNNVLPQKDDDLDKNSFGYKFIKGFSHLPFLPASMSRISKGIVGILLLVVVFVAVAVTIGLIPFFMSLANPVNNEPKKSFSIDVKNGLNLQNQALSGILSTIDTNRTVEQNSTLLSETNNLSNQLNEKVMLKLDRSIDKFFNLRLTPNQQGSVDVSFSIKTKPITTSDLNIFKDKLPGLIRASTAFADVKLTNSTTIFVNPNILFDEPIEGEISVKPLQLSFSPSKSALQSEQIASLGLENNRFDSSLESELKNPQGRPGPDRNHQPNNGPNRDREHNRNELDREAIAQSSQINKINDYPQNFYPYANINQQQYNNNGQYAPNNRVPSNYPTNNNYQSPQNAANNAYPTQNKVYPAQYPSQNNVYPAANNVNPTQNNVYPTQNNAYPTQNNAYPTQNNAYPTQNSAYQTQNNANPTQNNQYPAQNNAYPTQNIVYPNQNNAYPTYSDANNGYGQGYTTPSYEVEYEKESIKDIKKKGHEHREKERKEEKEKIISLIKEEKIEKLKKLENKKIDKIKKKLEELEEKKYTVEYENTTPYASKKNK